MDGDQRSLTRSQMRALAVARDCGGLLRAEGAYRWHPRPTRAVDPSVQFNDATVRVLVTRGLLVEYGPLEGPGCSNMWRLFPSESIGAAQARGEEATSDAS